MQQFKLTEEKFQQQVKLYDEKIQQVDEIIQQQVKLNDEKMERLLSLMPLVQFTTSYRDLHLDLVKRGLSKMDPTVIKEVVQQNITLLPITSPDVGDEKVVVQPFWSNKIEELNQHLADVNPVVRFYDSHGSRILPNSGQSPDIVVLTAGGNPTCINIVIIGELKGKGNMNDGASGQIEDYLGELLKSQCFRDKAYGFLTDNISLQVVLAERMTTGDIMYTWCCDEKWNGGNANHILSSLVSLSLEDLFYTKPVVKVNGQEIALVDTLGRGLSGIVYGGNLNGKSIVVKVPKTTERLDKEERVLAALERGGVKSVPLLYGGGTDEDNRALLMTPVAKHFAHREEPNGVEMASCHIRQIVQALYGAHKLGYIHRDVRYSNIFAVSEEEALLSDWGSAWFKGEPTSTYEGVIIEASDRILDNLTKKTEFVPLPADDLHALARTVYCYLYKPPPVYSTNDDLQKFWKNVSNEKWIAIFSMADQIDYEDFSTYKNFADSLSIFLPN